jgi:hypothetical protein
MNLQTESICRYFLESWNKFIAYVTITDGNIDGIYLSVYSREFEKKLLYMPLSLMEIY